MAAKKLNLTKETLKVLAGESAQVQGAGTKYCGFTVTCEASKGNNSCRCLTDLCVPTADCLPSNIYCA